MAAGDDLVPLFAGTFGESLGYRQGKLTAWDAGTLNSTVLVGGAPLNNLPILNTAGLTVGDSVGVLTAGSRRDSWLILGRLNIPT